MSRLSSHCQLSLKSSINWPTKFNGAVVSPFTLNELVHSLFCLVTKRKLHTCRKWVAIALAKYFSQKAPTYVVAITITMYIYMNVYTFWIGEANINWNISTAL